MNKIKKNKFVLLGFVSVFLLSATLGKSFITEAPFEKTASSDSIDLFPQAGKFYTLAGRSFVWEVIDGENVSTAHSEEIFKESIEDIVDDVVSVNRTYVEAYIHPQTGRNYIDTYDFDYEIATNRTILSARCKIMSFDTTGFLGSTEQSLDEDVGEHTWAWFPKDLYVGAYVLVGWTFDRNFLGDMLYQVVGDEVIEILDRKQDCWLLRMPPCVRIDGTQGRAETYWVDKDIGIPLKSISKGWALDGSFGWEGEWVLVNTNIDLGPESAEEPSPTYTLTVPSTPGFPAAGKFWSWYVLENGWNMRDASNVRYYQEGLLTLWVANVINDEALVYKIYWGDYLCDREDVEELEAVNILYTIYRANTTTREIIEAISSLIYHVNMTSLTYEIIDRTALLAGDVGEETYCWLPTNIHIGAKVNITWSYDRPWTLDNATYTVIDEKILSALGEPQACWVLYLPTTASIDGTWNYSETWDSDKDIGIPLYCLSEGEAVDGSSAYVENCWLMDTNVDLRPPFPQPGMSYTLAGRTIGWVTVDSKNITSHNEEIQKWSVQDVVGDIAFVNRTFLDVYICPETGGNYTDTYDFDYQIDTNRTILSAYWKQMSFDTTGFLGADEGSLAEDVGERTWGWFPTDLRIGAYVLVSWTWDRRFPGDMLYEVVGEEVIEVVDEKQDCWLLHMPPVVTIDGTQGRTETYWVDKDTGIPLKLYSKGWALDESFGWEGEDVLVHTNIDLGPESTQTPSPTYTLAVPSTPGFPQASKFYTSYIVENGWYMSGETNITYYTEGLWTIWVVNVTGNEAFVHRILWYEQVSAAESLEELEAAGIQYYNYTINTNTREILNAAGSFYSINMTSLTYSVKDRTPTLAGDIGEETWYWLPKNLYLGAVVSISWTYDMPSMVDNGTYTVTGEKMVNAFGKPQECWILCMPPTPSIDGTWNYTETYYSDKDVGIFLVSLLEGWTIDGNSAFVYVRQLIDTNVDLGPSTYYLTITSTAGGTTSPLPGTYNYTEGSSHNVTAIPNLGYSFDYWLLDGEEKTENPITIVIDANHTLQAVYFAVDITPPNITNVSQNPPKNNVLPEDEVKINATVTDDLSEVKKVTLFYSYANSSGTWLRVVNMTNLEGNIWNATIPAFPYCTNVTYTIMAEDKAGNTITTLEMGFEYQYPVIPEFPTAIILPPIMIASLLAVVLYKKRKATFTMKHSTKPTCLTSDSA